MNTNSRNDSLHRLRNSKNLRTERLQRLIFSWFLYKILTFLSTNIVLLLMCSRTNVTGSQNKWGNKTKKSREASKAIPQFLPDVSM